MGIYRKVSRPQGKNPHRIFNSMGIVNILGPREVNKVRRPSGTQSRV